MICSSDPKINIIECLTTRAILILTEHVWTTPIANQHTTKSYEGSHMHESIKT